MREWLRAKGDNVSDAQHSTEGLMAIVQTYADQEVQCVARSEDEAYWGLFRERERIGDGIRAYLEAMVQNAYAEGRKDEREQILEDMRIARGKLDAALRDAKPFPKDSEFKPFRPRPIT